MIGWWNAVFTSCTKTVQVDIYYMLTCAHTYTVWPEILAGNLFWRGIYFGGLAVLTAIRQYFSRQKLHTVMSSLLQNHSLCTRPAARHASLIVGMEFTFESYIRGHHFSKKLCTPKERVSLSVNARKVVQMTCTQSLYRSTGRTQSRVRITTICSVLSCM